MNLSRLCRRAILPLLGLALSFLPARAEAEAAAGGTDGKMLPTVPTMRKAVELAKEDGRLVLVALVAWRCPHCEAFEKEVLASEVFRTHAGDALHLVIHDIKWQSTLSDEARAEIADLIKEHRVKFTPTILVFDRDGSLLLATTGYQGTPPESIVEHLKGLRK